MKPERWNDPSNKIVPYQVGFTSPPHDFDAAPHDFLKIAPEGVGTHGRLIHVESYAHELSQRVDNFHQLEEVVHCMSNAGTDVVGQVGLTGPMLASHYETFMGHYHVLYKNRLSLD